MGSFVFNIEGFPGSCSPTIENREGGTIWYTWDGGMQNLSSSWLGNAREHRRQLT